MTTRARKLISVTAAATLMAGLGVALVGCSSRTDTGTAPAATQQSAPLADRVQSDLLSQFGLDSFTQGLTADPESGIDPHALTWYITDVRDGAAGVVRLTAQVTRDQTSPAEVKQLAQQVMNLTQLQNPDLEWVVAQTGDGGITQQVQRNSHLDR